MGRRAVREKKTKTSTRTTGKITERSVKRDELDIIASICGTTRNQVGKVSFETSGLNEKQNDVRTECTKRERSISSGSTTPDAVESDERERDSTTTHIYI